MLDLDELLEEYAEHFGTVEGQFDFSTDDQGPCFRFLTFREYKRYTDFYGPYVSTPRSVLEGDKPTCPRHLRRAALCPNNLRVTSLNSSAAAVPHARTRSM